MINLECLFRYAQYGDVSPKIDVYAFGVVLYELISAKEAVIKTNEVVTESKGLVALVVILPVSMHQNSNHQFFFSYYNNLSYMC